MKVLVVDDERDILMLLTFRLKKAGYEILVAKDGKLGLELAQKEKPNLILLDLRLPIMDGYEVCKKLKSADETKDIPIIFLTASSGSSIADATREFGANDYLIKPFEPEVLLEKVKKYIK